MAYMNQERKAKLAPAIKAICKKYGVKASLAVNHHMSLVLNIKAAPFEFVEGTNYDQVNVYHYDKHYNGKALEFLSEVIPAMNVGNHDRSDLMTDYFDVGWYVRVNVGQWNKPYQVLEAA